MQQLMDLNKEANDCEVPETTALPTATSRDPIAQESSATVALENEHKQQSHGTSGQGSLPMAAGPPAQQTHSTNDDEDGNDEDRMIIRANRRAISIVTEGGKRWLSRAAKVLMQSPLAEINEAAMQRLRQLHPTATQGMQRIPSGKGAELTAIDPQMLLQLIKRRVNNGSAPGPSGWTGSHLQLVAQCDSAAAKEGLCLLIRDVCNGVFGGHTHQRLLASVLTPISKPGGGVRPIAMGEVMVKLAAHYLMTLIEEKLPSLFPRIQYGVKRAGGSESAAQLIRAAIRQSQRHHPDTIALKTDFENAFNAASRAQLWSTMLQHDTTQPIWRMFYWAYATPTPLLIYDRGQRHDILWSSEGVRQGDPFASFAFALGVQKLYEDATESLPDCKAVSILDDLTLIGPCEQVMKAYDRIHQQAASYHLKLRVDKCQVFLPTCLGQPTASDDNAHDGSIPQANQRNNILNACVQRQLPHDDKMEVLGVIMGSDSVVTQQCDGIAASHGKFFKHLMHPSMPVQIASMLLRVCGLPRLSYMARTVHPSMAGNAAESFDRDTLGCFLKIFQFTNSSRPSKGEAELSQEQVEAQISLPISMGGMGMRPTTRILHAAYFSSLAAVMPDFLRLFPNCTDYEQTTIHHELITCRQELLRQGVGPSKQGGKRQGKDKNPKGSITPKKVAESKRAMSTSNNTNTVTTPPRTTRTHSEPSPSLNHTHTADTVNAADSLTLHSSMMQLWQRAREHAAKVNTPMIDQETFLNPQKLQHDITAQIEEKLYKRLLNDSTPRHQVVLTSLHTRGCNAYLTVLPTQPCYRMQDGAFRLAVRHRLGLLPFDTLTDAACNRCPHPTTFSDDPDHLHSCSLHRRTLVTERHNNIMQVVMDLARSVGFHVRGEPNDHVRPSKVANPQGTHYNNHADILLVKHDQRIYVDVTITRPTNSTNMQIGKVRTTPAHSTKARTRAKHRKYDDIAACNQYQLLAFPMETYGGLGDEALELLHILSKHSKDEYSERQFLSHAFRRLSVTLQRANANIQSRGMYIMQMWDYSGLLAVPHRSPFPIWLRLPYWIILSILFRSSLLLSNNPSTLHCYHITNQEAAKHGCATSPLCRCCCILDLSYRRHWWRWRSS